MILTVTNERIITVQNSLIQMQGDNIVINANYLILIGAIAIVAVILLVVAAIFFKRRNRGFVKTMPTNVKDVE